MANYRAMTRRGDRFVAISHRQRDLFAAAAEERFGPGERINFVDVIHNPIDVAAAPFYPAEKKARLRRLPRPLPLGEEPGRSDPRGPGGRRAADDGAAGHDRGAVLLRGRGSAAGASRSRTWRSSWARSAAGRRTT